MLGFKGPAQSSEELLAGLTFCLKLLVYPQFRTRPCTAQTVAKNQGELEREIIAGGAAVELHVTEVLTCLNNLIGEK
jgi:hypothetical protein